MTTILVTGGTGCIGASTVHHLLSANVERILVTSRRANPTRIAMWQGTGVAALDSRLELITLDLTDEAAMARLVRREQPTHIIHLAALQSPACDADPTLGLRINLGGVMSLLQSVDDTLQRFVFASSAAVYGRRALYPEATISEQAPLAPPNLYGVWKMAAEQLARLFHERSGIPTVCLRLNATYGPGRDLGKTAAPTSALKAIARGAAAGKVEPFEMPYQGRENYHYVEDVGVHFARCTLQPFSGFAALNIKGTTVDVAEFLAIAHSVAKRLGVNPFSQLGIANDAEENLFVCDLDHHLIDELFPGMPLTRLEQGIERSVVRFLEMAQRGELDGKGNPKR